MNLQFTDKLVEKSLQSFGINTFKEDNITFDCQTSGIKVFEVGKKCDLQEEDILEKVELYILSIFPTGAVSDVSMDTTFGDLLKYICVASSISKSFIDHMVTRIIKEYELSQNLLWKENIFSFHKSIRFLSQLVQHPSNCITNRISLAEQIHQIIFTKSEGSDVDRVTCHDEYYFSLFIETIELACRLLKQLSSLQAESVFTSLVDIDLKSLSTIHFFKYFCIIGARTLAIELFFCHIDSFRKFLVDKATLELKNALSVILANHMDKKITLECT